MDSQFVSASATMEIEDFSKPSSANRFCAVPAMIASRIFEGPNAPALVHKGRCVSFAELDRLASKVAASLRSAGVRRADPVGVYFESSIEFVAAALGVWKVGAAYLPIDPAYPVDRALYILSDSGAPAVITRSGLAATLNSDRWKTLIIEELPAAEAAEDAAVASADLAYVIYTSGSTGQPKGVEITHGNLVNLVEWHNREFSVTGADRATQIAGPGFDAAVWEVWPYLAAGASIHFPTREARFSGTQMRDWLLAERITISFVPTVLAEEIIGLTWPANSSLRYLLTGGDALHTFPSEGIPFQLVNNYGPTECTVVATSAPVAAGQLDQGSPAIGRAILNTSIYLLDEGGNEVADGEAGELYIGGPSVGRGYRNRPDLTAESFVYIRVAGRDERVFRTGDLARRLPDGQFAFVGRADDQIKIRGFRIEPDEIASVLNRHPMVVSSAVIARTESGEKRLVAYIVPTEGAEIWDRDLREVLTRHLPDYMVPANFVLMSRIPVTPNGKLDKAALPAPNEQNQVRRDSYVAPRNEFEEIVEGMIAPILGLERVSIHDNFFLLGGHSLMGAQLIAKVRDIFDVELVLRNVFECPTVAKLAARIETLLTARLDAMSDEEVDEALRADPLSQVTGNRSAIGAD
jgi:amino acid adenylation domain-containing protein